MYNEEVEIVDSLVAQLLLADGFDIGVVVEGVPELGVADDLSVDSSRTMTESAIAYTVSSSTFLGIPIPRNNALSPKCLDLDNEVCVEEAYWNDGNSWSC